MEVANTAVNAAVIAAVGLILGWLVRSQSEAARHHADARFDAVDQRLNAVEQHSDARFNAVDQRFDRLEEKLGEGSTASRSESIAGSTGWSADVTSGTSGAGRRRTRGLGARYSAREGEGRGPRRR